MKNPWLAKNPLMSMWLSGANSMWGAARGQATAAAHRHAAAMMTEGTRQMIRFWTGAAAAPAPAHSRRRKKIR